MDDARVHLETRAGDPFTSFAPPQDHPHACLNGRIYLGYTSVGEDGDEVEAYEAIPCRRCLEDVAGDDQG